MHKIKGRVNIVWRTKLKFTLPLVLSLLFLLPCGCLAEEASPQTITMSIAQFQQLQAQTQLLDTKLQLALTLLTEPQKQALLQATLLVEAKKQIQLSQQELQIAKTSLANASKLTEEQNSSLMKLSKEIKQERATQNRKAIQKTAWGILGGFILGYAVK